MTEDVFKEIFRRVSGDRPSKRVRRRQTFRLGKPVRIVSGPFACFTGTIEGINKSKTLLLVEASIFGRSQPIKINFMDAENIPE
jgi:transcriptional antiterminator NusG